MHLDELHLPLDVILHPRRTVLTLEFSALEREVRQIFRSVQNSAAKGTLPPPQPVKRPRA
jgi:ribonuclease P protein component